MAARRRASLLKLFHFTQMYFMSSISVELFIFYCHLCLAGQEFVIMGLSVDFIYPPI
ncbi:hypothetical protein NA56DRAFT_645111 [Hyaloscypha hepaticicola]|uniref:Uncharacterized protein n=1 Tax=Hyaloscypha hepaticicola TaxID=2082293 RepID=A0A2J6Q6F0_9HELO|nr:hypothetical protein NA56DRAFT_645111 [Hyaloscypha hepaticicola]